MTILYDTTKPFKHALKHIVQKTWANNPYIAIEDGYYTSFRRKHNGVEFDHTDGIGTKGVVHWTKKTWAAAAQDALAMNVNDLAIAGARAFKLQAHLMVPEDDHDAIVAIMREVGKLCEDRRIAITGGETGVHHNLRGMELSLTVSGIQVEKRSGVGVAQEGDVFVLVPSSGVHSNGFTLVGTLFEGEHRDWMTVPTALYDRLILDRGLPINAAMHITGGAWDKVKEIMPHHSVAHFEKWLIPKCFAEIYDKYAMMYDAGLFRKELKPLPVMYRTFNMGIGLVLAVPEREAAAVAKAVGGFIGGSLRVSPQPTHSYDKRVGISTELSEEKVTL